MMAWAEIERIAELIRRTPKAAEQVMPEQWKRINQRQSVVEAKRAAQDISP